MKPCLHFNIAGECHALNISTKNCPLSSSETSSIFMGRKVEPAEKNQNLILE